MTTIRSSNDHGDNIEDEPSHTASCIAFSLTTNDQNKKNTEFHPIYTHQIFHEDQMSHFEPLLSSSPLSSAGTTTLSMPQCRNRNKKQEDDEGEKCTSLKKRINETATLLKTTPTHELDVKIILSPSCRSCHVTVSLTNKETNNIKKKEEENDDESTMLQHCRKKRRVGFAIDDDDSNKKQHEPSSSSSTTKTITTAGDIHNRIIPHLPPLSSSKDEVENDYLTTLPGTTLNDNNDDNDGMIFTHAKGTDPYCQSYHACIQKLAPWFIETGSDVSISQTDGGYWTVVYLFQQRRPSSSSTNIDNNNDNVDVDNKKQQQHYSLVGYATLFHFHSPFKKPIGGEVIRVCQVLIMTPYQRRGYGKRLIETIYHNIVKQKEQVVELNVEDPAPAFCRLRDGIDLELYRRRYRENSRIKKQEEEEEEVFCYLSEKDVMKQAAELKIIPRQYQRAREIHELSKLVIFLEQQHHEQKQQQQHDTTTTTTIESKKKKVYRLAVKKRLLKLHMEELSVCQEKTQKQQKLSVFFNDLMKEYLGVLKKEKGSVIKIEDLN